MKSKLFLSLSLLTAVCSMSANETSYFERAKTSLSNGCKTVTASTKAIAACAVQGCKFVATGAVNGYESSLKFVKKHPRSTATVGAVAAVAVLGYVAYKYRKAIFGNSKKANVDQTPVAASAPVRVRPFTRG